MSTIDLIIKTQSFNDNNFLLSLKGFYFKFESNIYILSIHHNLPIKNITFNDINLDIIINSQWSEVLILDGINYNKKYKLYKIIQNKLPKINNIIHMLKYSLIIVDYEFINFDNIDGPEIPYIKCKLLENDNINYNILKGLSGTPVFFNNKIIGIFSNYILYKYEHYIRILPIYIYIKNLKKNNNNDIYTSSYNIKKINRYNVINDNNIKKIYHNKLNIKVPLTTYFLLELDISNILININNNNYILKDIKLLTLKEIESLQIEKKKTTHNILSLYYNNNNNIILNDNKYYINIRLLKLIKYIFNDGFAYKLITNNIKKLPLINNKI